MAQKTQYRVIAGCLLGAGGKKYRDGDIITADQLVDGEQEVKSRIEGKYIEEFSIKPVTHIVKEDTAAKKTTKK